MSCVVLVAPARCLFTPWSSSLAAIHSITSSARARSVAGTVMPSALAVFILMTSWKRVGCSTGKSAGLGAFEDFVDIHGSLAKKVRIYRGVRHQPAFVGEPARHRNCRHTVLQRQLGRCIEHQEQVAPCARGQLAFGDKPAEASDGLVGN